MTTPIQTIYRHLLDNGHLDAWGGPDDVEQVAPTVQLRSLQETALEPTDRLILIRMAAPGFGSRFTSSVTYSVSVYGGENETPAYAETLANNLFAALLEFDHGDCVIGIDPISGVFGPYVTESNRQVYVSEWSVKVDNGIIS